MLRSHLPSHIQHDSAQTWAPASTNRPALQEGRRARYRRRPMMLFTLISTNAAAALAGLIVPRLLGDLVDTVRGGGATTSLVTAAIIVVLLQTEFTFSARGAAAVLGQGVLAEAREYVVRTILRLPLGRVESASPGDLGHASDPRRVLDEHRRPVGVARRDHRRHHRAAHPRRDAPQLVATRPSYDHHGGAVHRPTAALPQGSSGSLPVRGRELLPDQLHPHRNGRV